MLARMKLDSARMELLAAFFETYLKLNRRHMQVPGSQVWSRFCPPGISTPVYAGQEKVHGK